MSDNQIEQLIQNANSHKTGKTVRNPNYRPTAKTVSIVDPSTEKSAELLKREQDEQFQLENDPLFPVVQDDLKCCKKTRRPEIFDIAISAVVGTLVYLSLRLV